MKKITYLILINLLIVFAWVSLPSVKILRFVLAFLQSLFFVVWGWEIHEEKKSLNHKNMLEYLILGVLGLALISFLIYYD